MPAVLSFFACRQQTDSLTFESLTFLDLLLPITAGHLHGVNRVCRVFSRRLSSDGNSRSSRSQPSMPLSRTAAPPYVAASARDFATEGGVGAPSDWQVGQGCSRHIEIVDHKCSAEEAATTPQSQHRPPTFTRSLAMPIAPGTASASRAVPASATRRTDRVEWLKRCPAGVALLEVVDRRLGIAHGWTTTS